MKWTNLLFAQIYLSIIGCCLYWNRAGWQLLWERLSQWGNPSHVWLYNNIQGLSLLIYSHMIVLSVIGLYNVLYNQFRQMTFHVMTTVTWWLLYHSLHQWQTLIAMPFYLIWLTAVYVISANLARGHYYSTVYYYFQLVGCLVLTLHIHHYLV